MSRRTNTATDFNFWLEIESFFHESPGTHAEKMASFAKYVPRQRLTDFLSLYEVFRKVLDIPGSVIDCGTWRGRALMAFAQLSAILEPLNYQRKIIGFDTFTGFPSPSEKDVLSSHEECREGGYAADGAFEDLKRCIALFDANRPLSHIPKVMLVKGDIRKTGPDWLAHNPHTVVSLLNLDLGLYEASKAALDIFLPRMPRGAVIVFGEMNCPDFVGEVQAVAEAVGIRNLRLQRNGFDTVASHAVLD
jgi:hypothetical protein